MVSVCILQLAYQGLAIGDLACCVKPVCGHVACRQAVTGGNLRRLSK